MAHLERMDDSALTVAEIAISYHGCIPCPGGYSCPNAGMT